MRHVVRLWACWWMLFGLVPLVGAQQLGQPQQPRQQPQQPRQPQQPGQQPGQPGQPPAAAAQMDVVAVVNSDPITRQELDASLQMHLRGREIDPETAQQLQRQVLESLIESRLVEQYVLEHGPEVQQEEIQAVLGQLQQQLEGQGLSLQQFLAERGQTVQGMQQRVHGSLAWQKFQQEQLTEEKLQDYFQRNPEQFEAETFEEGQQEVAQVYAGELWTGVVQKMRPEAEIKMAAPAQAPQAPQSPAPGIPGQR